MANRHILAISQLDDFKKWLVSDGWEIQKTVGEWEVLRAVKQEKKHPLIVYSKLETNNDTPLVHLTVLDRDVHIIWQYLKSKKENS